MVGMLLDKPADGIPILQQALRESPTGGRAITWDTLGTACQQAGQWEQAIKAYIEAVRRADPKEDGYLQQLARENLAEAQIQLFGDGPIPDWANVVNVSAERQRELQWRQADKLHAAGQYEQALSLYQQVLATCPPHARQTQIGAFMLGTCYQALGETAKAVEQFEKVIRDNDPLAGEARKALERLRSAGAQNKSG